MTYRFDLVDLEQIRLLGRLSGGGRIQAMLDTRELAVELPRRRKTGGTRSQGIQHRLLQAGALLGRSAPVQNWRSTVRPVVCEFAGGPEPGVGRGAW